MMNVRKSLSVVDLSGYNTITGTSQRDAATMNARTEEQIRSLAEPLWESAARPYGMAMDFWLMAEQMVVEMMTATARLQRAAIGESLPPDWRPWLPEAMPVSRVREMAECMWQAAGQNLDMAQDVWLAAERHVLAMLRVSALEQTKPAAETVDAVVTELVALPPQAYVERIRVMAYYFWESAGRQYGQALDYWLQAEQNVLGLLTAAARGADTVGHPRQSTAID
jgi:hypothetical protein